MEIVGTFFLLGLIMFIAERTEQRNQFPDQLCAYCPMAIHFDFKARRWIHEDGRMYAASPGLEIDDTYRGHPAMPPFNNGYAFLGDIQ